jgi:hypothetical protein
MPNLRSLALCWPLLILAGCADKQPKPIMVSAADLPAYAVGYADRLSVETELLVADKQQANEQSQKLNTRTSELKPGADPATVLAVVRLADHCGKTDAYARANTEARNLNAFWKEERGPITARANGAAQKQLTEGNCGTCSQLDLGGSLGYAIGAGIDKQLEKRLRAINEAHRTIENNEERIGAANVPTLQKWADDIALTSYQVNVALPQARDRIDGLLSEQEDVDEALGRAIEWEKSYQASARTAGEKKRSQERLAILEKSRAAIPAAVTNANAARKDLDPLIEALRKRYAETMEALETDLEAQQARAAK